MTVYKNPLAGFGRQQTVFQPYFDEQMAVVEETTVATEILWEINTDDQLWEWVAEYCGILIPRIKVCEDHVAPFTAFADAYFARHPRTVWKASRGFGGKTVLLAALSYTEACTLGARVSLLGGSGEQSQRVHEYMAGEDTNIPDTYWGCKNAPTKLLRNDPTRRVTLLRNGGSIKALMASQRSVRGPHPQRLRGDEIDEMDEKIWDAAQGQPMESRGIAEQVVGSSTHQNVNGTFTRELNLAADRGWPVYEWCVPPGTLITMADGRKRPIERVIQGDLVITEHGRECRVSQTWKRWYDGPLVSLRIAGLPEPLRCTPEHRVLTARGWITAGELMPRDRMATPRIDLQATGDRMATARGQAIVDEQFAWHKVLTVDRELYVGHVYDLTVEDDHTFLAAGVVVSNCYRETMAEGGFITAEQVQRKKTAITVATWVTEYEGQEPAPEDRAIQPECVDAMFDRELGLVQGSQQREPIIFAVPSWEKDPKWLPFTDKCFEKGEDAQGRTIRLRTKEWHIVRKRQLEVRAKYPEKYAQGTDWGKQRDHSISIVVRYDQAPYRLVAWLNNVRLPYPDMFQSVGDLTDRYFANSVHDKTGLGTVADDYVYEGTRGVSLVGAKRSTMFSSYIVAIEAADYLSPEIVYLHRELKFATNEDLYMPSGHPPDGFIAGALAHEATLSPPLLV